MGTKIMDLLQDEIDKHQNPENVDQSSSWGRGFGEGALAEAISLKNKIHKILLQMEKTEKVC